MKTFSVNKGLRVLFYSLVLASLPISALARAHASPSGGAIFQQAVTGTVSDDSGPLPGATVMVKGTTRSVATDLDGKFSIAASPEDVLVFSFTGFVSVELVVGTQSNVSITLQLDVTQLEEVTINAGYYSVKQKEATGSIARITAKDIETQPVTNTMAALQGRMPGVQVTQTSGVPGGAFDIQIRGTNSLRAGANNPLYIIDGMPYDATPIGSNYTTTTTPLPTSPLNSISPSDIASIEILKDADATAIYGSRGANGVVLITTKRGRAGKTAFTGTVSSGFGRVTHFLDLMDTRQYLEMRREAFANDGMDQYPPNAYDVNGTWDQDRYTDWQKELIGGTASFTAINASVSGGSDNTNFLLASNYNRETTVFPGDFRYSRANVLSSLNHTSQNNRFKAGFSSSYTYQDNLLPPLDFTREAIKLAPNAPALYDSQGNLNWENNTFSNPLANLQGSFTANTYDLIASTTLSYSIWKGLQAKATLGYSDLRHTEKQTLPSTRFNPSFGLGSESSQVYVNATNRNSWIIEPQLLYGGEMGKLGFEALAGLTLQNRLDQQVVHLGSGFASNSLIGNPASAEDFSILNSYGNIYRYQAVFARLNANWDRRYFINITGRRDGSSRFGPERRFASFGAVGAAWIFSREAWLAGNLPFLSFGKLRASYGTTGSDQIGDYQYLNTYSSPGRHYGGINGLEPTRLFNPDFGWETNRKMELALEAGFLKDRVSLTVAYFDNRAAQQLVGIPLPGTTGFTQIQANLDATVQNKGLEFTLHTINIQNKNFSWSTSFNISRLRNKLLSFPGLEGSTYKSQYEIGKPVNIVKAYHYNGIDPQTGMYQFIDVNGDGVVNALGDRTKAVDLNPDFFGGLANELQWGPLQLDFLFQFVKQQNFNQSFNARTPGIMLNQPTAALERWQQPGDAASYQRYGTETNAPVQIANTRFTQSDAVISDASYIRLKNIAVSFELPAQWTGNTKCRISIQAQNLLTFTSFKGADPEFKTPGALPPLKMFATSLNINF